MEYKHSKIISLIEDNNELSKVFIGIVKNVDGSYLLDEIKKFLDDNNVHLNMISDKNKISLVSLMRKYYNACGETFIVNMNLDKLADGAVRSIYSINAPSGVRIATKSEVENGVLGLVEETQYLISEEKYKLLNLLVWTITGRLGFYRKAGFSYNYDKETGLLDTIYDMVMRSAEMLTSMMEWVGNTSEFNRDIKALKKNIKAKYKYPEYAIDEVMADINVKKLLFNLNNNLDKFRGNPKYKEVIHLVLRQKEDRHFKYTPGNISILRKAYIDLTSGLVGSNENDNELRDVCEELIEDSKLGYISSTHFVFKIIASLKAMNYNRCSEKQYKIIREAVSEVASKKNNAVDDVNSTNVGLLDNIDEILTGTSLVAISNELGKGLI